MSISGSISKMLSDLPCNFREKSFSSSPFFQTCPNLLPFPCRSSRWRRHLLQGSSALDPSAVAIRLTTKPCPGCRAPTERSGGCMHMVCAKAACGLNWCWVCQARWTRECMAAHWFG